jgi:hypothetical protein
VAHPLLRFFHDEVILHHLIELTETLLIVVEDSVDDLEWRGEIYWRRGKYVVESIGTEGVFASKYVSLDTLGFYFDRSS